MNACPSYRSDFQPEKTRLVKFRRFAAAKREGLGLGKPETFDCLGLTHHLTTTKGGRFRLGRKPIARRMPRTLKRIKEVLRKRWHYDRWEIGGWLGHVLNGGTTAPCPGERLVMCCNPALAERRRNKCEALLAATEEALERIRREVDWPRFRGHMR